MVQDRERVRPAAVLHGVHRVRAQEALWVLPLPHTPFWDSFLAGFAYPTDDELGLIMAAPARLVEGQYRRALYIDGTVAYTDFMVSLPAGDCWFSKLGAARGYTFGACFPARDYEQRRFCA